MSAARSWASGYKPWAGRKNHLVVMPDADIEQAVDGLIGAAYGSAGERCMAISVAVLVGGVADEVVGKLAARTQALKVKGGMETDAEMGPVITREALERIKGCIEAGVREGAELVVDGRAFDASGCGRDFSSVERSSTELRRKCAFIKKRSSDRCSPVCGVKDCAEAVQLVNGHEFGNGVACYTRDGRIAREFARRIQVGMVGINVPIPVPMAMAWVRRLEEQSLRRHARLWRGRGPVLHPAEVRHAALAGRHAKRRRVCHPKLAAQDGELFAHQSFRKHCVYFSGCSAAGYRAGRESRPALCRGAALLRRRFRRET